MADQKKYDALLHQQDVMKAGNAMTSTARGKAKVVM